MLSLQRGMITMICINATNSKILIRGHTESAICSSISSIMYTSLNALLAYDKECFEFYDDANEDYVEITLIKCDDFAQLLFDNMINCFNNVSEQYPECVDITKIV